MAGEIQVSYKTGVTCFFNVRSSYSGGIWNGTGFEAYVTANIGNYDISMTEQGTASAYYVGDFPTAIGGGIFNVTAKERIGGSPAETDPTIGVGEINWVASGPVRALTDLPTSGTLNASLPLRITRGNAVSGFMFKMVSAADHVTAFTSGIVSGQVNKDGAGWVSLQSGTAVAGYVEQGLGIFKVSLTSGDLDAGTIALHFDATGVSGGTADPRDLTIVTQRG